MLATKMSGELAASVRVSVSVDEARPPGGSVSP